MKLSLLQSDLNSALQILQKAVPSRSILPVLSGILFKIEEGYLDLYSTDLEISVKYRLNIDAKGEDSAVLPARLLGDIVKSLPDLEVDIEIDENSGNAKLTCGQAAFNIKTYPVEDFPKFPDLEVDKSITVDCKNLSYAIRQVVKSVSRDETRPVLCGMLLTFNKGRLTMVSTDSYRLAVNEMSVSSSVDDGTKVIVPARCMDEVSRICSDENIEIGLAKNQIYFNTGEVIIVSRLIEGNFPNYQQLLPENCELRVKVAKDKFMSALKRVSLLAQNNALIKIKIEKENLQMSAVTADIGSAIENVDVQVDGTGMEIAFNANYLIDGLNSISEEEVLLELNNPLKPGILRPVEAQNFIYLVMPVRIG